jgi:hypothetical protein
LTKPTRNLSCNPLCGKCLRHCKQPPAAVLVDCPRYLPRPFKIARHRFDQLELFGGKKS